MNTVDLKRLQMVFTSLPAGGLLEALSHAQMVAGAMTGHCSP